MARIAIGVAALVAAAALAGEAGGAADVAQALPAKQIEAIVQAKGEESNGVLSMSPTLNVDVHLHSAKIDPAFQLSSDLDFQGLKGGNALFNGDIPVRAPQMNAVIDAILANHLVFQAEHQHFYDFSPVVWFVHFRGVGAPTALAAGVHAVLVADRMSLPQAPPENPRTPFDWKAIKAILGASSATTDEDGVVTFDVDRKAPVDVGGFRVDKELNVQTTIAFEPLNRSGSRAAAAPDFGMTGDEIQRVVGVMRAQGWDVGCLYNQETNESPQLYFSHEFKTGSPLELAREIRKGLDQMAVEH